LEVLMGALRRFLALHIILLAVLPACTSQLGGGVLVIPLTPNAKHAGKTYSEWSTEWWKWALGQSVSTNPLFDTTGANAAEGQTGNVWFLGATFGDPPSVARNISVPSGTSFFFPLINFEEDSAFAPAMTVPEMVDEIALKAAQITELHLIIDGVSMPDLTSLRARATSPFSVSLPPGGDDVYSHFGVDAGSSVSTVLSDGYWAFIDALPAGSHTISFGGTQSTDGSLSSISATYTITVKP
jgi:hypothetical protein